MVQGDFEPGTAFVNANSSGMTFNDQACSTPNSGDPIKNCGPYWEWNGDKRFVNGRLIGEENTSELSSALYNVPTSARLFSIYLTLPQYDFKGCEYNVSASGCSYEGYVPSISGVWALDVGSGNSSDSYSLAVSLSESCSETSSPYGSCVSSANAVSVGISTAAFVDGAYDSSLSKNLAPRVPALAYNSSSSTYKISMATDLRTYLDVWVGAILEYSSSIVPIPFGDSYALNFYQFDNVDNMTLSTTWRNMTAYSSPGITVTGLSSGMSVLAGDGSGYSASAMPDANGTAVLVAPGGLGTLVVSVEQNGAQIANYTGTLGTGAEFKLVVT